MKDRIKNILNYKKPSVWITLISVILIVCLLVGFMTAPASENKTDKKEEVQAVVSEGEKENTSDTSSKPSTTDEDKDTESEPDESELEDTSGEQKFNEKCVLNGLSESKARKIINDYIGVYKEYFGETILKYKCTLSDSSIVLWIGDTGTEYPAVDKQDLIADQYLYKYSNGYDLKIYKNGQFKSIKNAYDTGLISKAVLDEFFKKYPNLNFAKSDIPEIRPANRPTDSGGGAQEFLDSLPELTEEEKQEALDQRGEIDSKLELEVKQAYVYLWASYGENFSVEKVTIRRYYGTYNGAAVVKITTPEFGHYTSVQTHIVADIMFFYPDSNYIVVYKNNGFYNIEEAYDEGILTIDDLKKIQIINGIIY